MIEGKISAGNMAGQTDRAVPPARKARRTSSDRLRAALLDLCDHTAQVIEHSERNWASITFSGTRHSISLLFSGAEAVAAAEYFIAALPDHEFSIPRQLVADATISEVEHRMLPGPRMSVKCEILMLEDE